MLKRVLKIGLAAALIAGSLGWYGYERFAMVSSEAFTVGFLLDVRAPADGRLKHDVHRFAELRAGAQLGVLQTDVADLPSAVVARAELAATRDTIATLKRSIALMETLQADASHRANQLRGRRGIQLRMVVSQSSARAAEAEAEYRTRQEAQKRRGQLCAAGLMAGLECDQYRYEVELSATKVDAVAESQKLAEFLHRSSEDGLDVGQEYGSELGYARQFDNELKLRCLNLKQDLAEHEGRERALAARVQLPDIPLDVNTRFQIWNVLKTTGSLVNHGDTLFEVVPCDEAHVLVTLDDSKYKRLTVGQVVVVTLDGSEFTGTVKQLLGGLPMGLPAVRLVPPIPPYKGVRDSRVRVVLVFSQEFGKTKHACTPGLPVDVDLAPRGLGPGRKPARSDNKSGEISSL